MTSLQRQLSRNVLWNTLQTWGGAGLTIAASVVYARLLQPEAWGIYSTYLWLVTSGALIVNLGWNLTINKFVAEAIGRGDRAGAAGVVRRVIAIELATIGAFGLALWLGAPTLARAMAQPAIMGASLAIGFGVAAMALSTTAAMGLIALQRYPALSATTLLTNGLGLIGGVAWLNLNGDPAGLIAVTALANLAQGVICLLHLNRDLQLIANNTEPQTPRPRLLAYWWTGTLILLLIQVVYERAEVFFLSRYRSAEEVGYYSLAVAMTNLAIATVPNVVIGPLLAMAADLHGQDDRAGLRQLWSSATRLLTLIAPPVGFGGALIAPPLIQLLYGDSYHQTVIAAAWLLPAAALLMIAKPATSLLWGIGQQRLMLLGLVPGAALNLALDYALIPTYGVAGAVAASVAAQCATTIVVTWFALRWLGYRFPWSSVSRSTLAALTMVGPGWLATVWLDGVALLGAELLIGGVMYPLGLLVFRAIEPGDVALLDRFVSRLPQPMPTVARLGLTRLAASAIASPAPPVGQLGAPRRDTGQLAAEGGSSDGGA